MSKAHASIAASHMAAGKSARKVIMQERNTTLETTSHISRNSSENVRKMPDERIPGKLICTIMAVVIVIVFVAMLHALRNRK